MASTSSVIDHVMISVSLCYASVVSCFFAVTEAGMLMNPRRTTHLDDAVGCEIDDRKSCRVLVLPNSRDAVDCTRQPRTDSEQVLLCFAQLNQCIFWLCDSHFKI